MSHRPCWLGNRPRPFGVWLSLTALAVQALLPLLLGFEIGLISAEADVQCIADVAHAGASHSRAPDGRDQSHHHHSLADGCPICLALAAGQTFTAANDVALPLPTSSASIVLYAARAPGRTSFAAASYNPRAPPSSI